MFNLWSKTDVYLTYGNYKVNEKKLKQKTFEQSKVREGGPMGRHVTRKGYGEEGQ